MPVERPGRRLGWAVCAVALMLVLLVLWTGARLPETTATVDPPGWAPAAPAPVAAEASAPVAGPSATSPRSAGSDMRTVAPPAECPPEIRELVGRPAEAIDSLMRRMRPRALGHAGEAFRRAAGPFEQAMSTLLSARARSEFGALSPDDYLGLVAAALSTSDWRVTALTLHLCAVATAGQAPACASLNPSRWAELDPENALAWTSVAARALAAQDAAAADLAMSRAAQARTARTLWGEVMRVAQSPALAGLPAAERQVLVMALIGTASQAQLSSVVGASTACSVDAIGVGARQAECGAIAELLVEQAESLLDLQIGVAIARRAGWDAGRLDALEADYIALSEALVQDFDLSFDNYARRDEAQACQQYMKLEAVMARVARGDEVAQARRALARMRAASVPAR